MSGAYAERPTQAQILRALKRVAPLQRDEVVASIYLGRQVCWKTRFFDALEINRRSIKQFAFNQRGWHRFSRMDLPIYGHIDIDQNPETGSMLRGRRVNLYGTIVQIDTVIGITLDLDRFEILPVNLLDRLVQRADTRI